MKNGNTIAATAWPYFNIKMGNTQNERIQNKIWLDNFVIDKINLKKTAETTEGAQNQLLRAKCPYN